MSDNRILVNGCSFSTKDTNTPGMVPYSKFLPGKTFNIAKRGSPIESDRVKCFIVGYTLDHKEDGKLTHFIYQPPTPIRQFVHPFLIETDFYLNIPNKIEENVRLISGYVRQKNQRPKWAIDSKKEHIESVKYKFGEQNAKEVKEITKKGKRALVKCLLEQFTNIERYEEKAINEINNNISMIRSVWPEAKVIFLRYEHSGSVYRVYEEFSASFFKYRLNDYCLNNNITYIYEDNFCTDWFWKNGLSADKSSGHPNEKGAIMIANKIKEYL